MEHEVLSGFTLSTLGNRTANAAELFEGAAERASAYQQVGLIAFGSRVYSLKLAVTRDQLVQREIMFERTCRNVKDIGSNLVADPKLGAGFGGTRVSRSLARARSQ